MSPSPAGVKRTPQRTCVACRHVRDKRELVRLVRVAAGDVQIDCTGKKEGRGAYLCPDPACWEKALKGKHLELHLKCRLSREDRERLIKDGAGLVKGVVSAQG